MLLKINAFLQPKPLLFILGTSIAYAVFRVLILPQDGENLKAFSHDSAYLAIVARNLLAGNGYINQAHWLVFIMPESLPMPYHNANPLFPTLTALLSIISEPVAYLSPIFSGYLISGLSGALLFFGISAFTFRCCKRIGRSLLVGISVVHFPAIFESTLHYGTDGLFTSLFVCFSLAITSQSKHSQWFAGVLLGLAWLAREQALLALPAVILLVWIRVHSGRGLKSFLEIFLPFFISVILVITPWLIRNKIALGKATYSDSAYYLFQDIYAKDFQRKGEAFGKSLEHFWHSTEKPDSPLIVISSDPVGFAFHILKALPVIARKTLMGWSLADKSFILLMLMGVVLFFVFFRPKPNPINLALILYCFTLFFVFSIRPYSFDYRYLNTICVFVMALSVYGYIESASIAKKSLKNKDLSSKICIFFALIGMLFIFLIVPLKAKIIFQRKMSIDEEKVRYFNLAQKIDTNYTFGKPVVVGTKPYFYTLATSASALSIPYDPQSAQGESLLLQYMDRYNASFIFLTDAEVTFWRPEWEKNPPADLFQIKRFGGAYLWRIKK